MGNILYVPGVRVRVPGVAVLVLLYEYCCTIYYMVGRCVGGGWMVRVLLYDGTAVLLYMVGSWVGGGWMG